MMINKFFNFGQSGEINQKNVKRNPDDYAKRYAKENKISIEEAKTTLKSQYGDPEENSQVSLSSDADYDSETSGLSTDVDLKSLLQKLMSLFRGPKETQGTQDNKKEGLPQDQDPDSYAEEYANANGLTLEEAKEELGTKYGKPEQPNKNFTV